MTVSVAMATYNGMAYIEQQVASILSQLRDGDELIVSDDGSADGTREWLDKLAATDSRVRVLDGPQAGVMKNFQNALSECHGDYVFLSDQDDVWHENKRKLVTETAVRDHALLVMHDARVVDGDGNELLPSFFAMRGTATGLLKNLWKNSYIGCCMAFSKKLLPFVLPFPDKIPMHDQWIGLQAEKHGKVSLIAEPLLDYRRHGSNVSGDTHGSLPTMLRQRAGMLSALLFSKRKDR